MPELPEVETIAAGVHARGHGARIARVWTSGKPQTFKSPESEIAAALRNLAIRLNNYVLDGPYAYLADLPTTVPNDAPRGAAEEERTYFAREASACFSWWSASQAGAPLRRESLLDRPAARSSR